MYTSLTTVKGSVCGSGRTAVPLQTKLLFVRRILAFTVGLGKFVGKNYSVSPIKELLIIILIKDDGKYLQGRRILKSGEKKTHVGRLITTFRVQKAAKLLT